ncbi:hypothetical protein [Brevundimonas sp.]|uniref:hypothetical protein n=1 Tax=Brevundimonas sp. TaxID=1871086 RepID=UPI00262B1485|nr:hypothetical protein [Brevundimonas sp.]
MTGLSAICAGLLLLPPVVKLIRRRVAFMRTPGLPTITAIVVGVAILIVTPWSQTAPQPSESSATPPPSEARLSLVAKSTSDTAVEFTVTTDAPTPIDVSASVSLRGQQPDDAYIGHSQTVTLTGPSTRFVVDTSDADEAVPRAVYEAEVSYFARWGAKNNPAAAQLPDMTVRVPVELEGSGMSRESAERAMIARRWVMENVSSRTPWSEALFVEKLGPFQRLEAARRPMIEAYYFPDVDMTILIYADRDEVMIWRRGRATD